MEHLANVSANELPALLEDFISYVVKYSRDCFGNYYNNGKINPYQVIPRLLLGNYLEYSFWQYISQAKKMGISIEVLLESKVQDIIPGQEGQFYRLVLEDSNVHADKVVLCTGHLWPRSFEGHVKGWFDSPYPPSKLSLRVNFPIAVRGASLTAVDAIKTLARANGRFTHNKDGDHIYTLHEGSPNFRIDLFSIRGFLPSLRFHSQNDAFSPEWTMTLDEIHEYKRLHGGFVDLDYVFEKNFKRSLQRMDPEFYESIKDTDIEGFVDKMLEFRNQMDSVELFRAEFKEAEKSIRRHQSISWKEALASFSYTVNYPAKHFSAEDMARLKNILMPLISIIIAALPQESYHEIIALYDQGLLRTIAVGNDSKVVPDEKVGGCHYRYYDDNGRMIEENYKVFIDAIGQRPLCFNDLQFDGLKRGTITPGFLYFRDAKKAIELFNKGGDNICQDFTG